MKEIHKKTPLAKQIKKYKSSYILLAPYSVLFLVFTLIPIAAAVLLSFTYFNMYEPPRWIGFTNYMNLFLADDVFIIALKNTLIFAFLTGPVGYVMSFIFAWLINEMKRVTRTFMTLFFYAPSLAGNVYFIWTYIFSGDAYGLVNSTLMRLNLVKEPVQWLYDPKYNIWIVVLVILWLSMGAGFLAFVAGLPAVDRSLYEAAAIVGVPNRFQELWYVT
ncbi:MAG: sugar ABC transporter permease, partial [Clostridia bacterium]|nr:sugar ABC transporter permease [Clostridia bacterium]